VGRRCKFFILFLPLAVLLLIFLRLAAEILPVWEDAGVINGSTRKVISSRYFEHIYIPFDEN